MSKSAPQFIIPFAKPYGITSFASLWQVKQALGTKKVGHTGTLDSFADGLLVLLSGKLTKLVPFITDFDKTYRVLFYFGKETDTLDPEGSVIAEKPLPAYTDFLAALQRFTGTIEQVPPVYSAVKQAGERLSDKIRRGEAVTAPPRTVTVYSIDIEALFFTADSGQTYGVSISEVDGNALHDGSTKKIAGALLRVRCSKGTYIRSLVRDIAHQCGSAAFVYALRRTAVGPFTLDQAAGAAALPAFNKDTVGTSERTPELEHPPITADEIERTALPFTADIARAMHFRTVGLKEPFFSAFITGMPISGQWFTEVPSLSDGKIAAVFFREHCIGLINKSGSRFCYQTVFGSS